MKFARYVAALTCPLAVFAQNPAEPYEQKLPGTTLSFKMMPIPAGDFSLGSADAEPGHQPDEGPARTVHINAFWMASLETSRDAFDAFANDLSVSQNITTDAVTRPSPQYIDFSLGMGKEGGYPVQSLSQYAALMYCRWLYEKTGVFYRLPTEAEWEYACRAGSKTTYYFGSTTTSLGDYAWYSSNSEGKFHKSGEKKPNAWGLYDMMGNVAEWTLDAYKADGYAGLAADSKGLLTSFNPGRYPKSVRGGSYRDESNLLRSAARVKSEPAWNRRDPQIPKSRWWLTEAGNVGFRVVRPYPQPSAAEIDAFFKQYLAQ